MISRYFLSLIVLIPLLAACDRNNNLNPISPEEDVMLGKQVHQQILSDPQQFPVLARSQSPEAYAFLDGIVDNILATGKVAYAEEFAWEVIIIDDAETINAFATPGGYIYVYTGLLDFLDSEDEIAGVIGHEIAHADLRHSSRQLLQVYGLQVLMSLIFSSEDGGAAVGDLLNQIANNLAQLQFSRDFEREANAASVAYLADSPYACGAIASFFTKMQEKEKGMGRIPEFLSTHPNPENRLQRIQQLEAEYNCGGEAKATL